MDIYKEMYYRLFNRTCDIMKNTTDKYAEYMIRQAHLETEEMFMNYEEACKPVINLLEYKKEKRGLRIIEIRFLVLLTICSQSCEDVAILVWYIITIDIKCLTFHFLFPKKSSLLHKARG